jgi:hypothetical protein
MKKAGFSLSCRFNLQKEVLEIRENLSQDSQFHKHFTAQYTGRQRNSKWNTGRATKKFAFVQNRNPPNHANSFYIENPPPTHIKWHFWMGGFVVGAHFKKQQQNIKDCPFCWYDFQERDWGMSCSNNFSFCLYEWMVWMV